MGRFERKKKSERVSEILDAALKVFNEKGFRNTTMEDIINETSLSKGGFYHYFKSTNDILLAIMESESYFFYNMMLNEVAGLTKDELIHAIAESIIARIVRENPSKKLFIMFFFEMLYKPEFIDKYIQIEEETFVQMEQDISKTTGITKDSLKRAAYDERMVFLARISSAIILVYHIFPGKKMMKKNLHYVEDFFVRILEDVFQ
ncbi:MAG: helix-turn-helix domain containing protein [Spirochaetales bacterium]|nr:helix-turn-helix domain containing protein [Spirochaetales bacterium]